MRLQVACRPARQQGAGTGVQLASVWIEAAGAERVDGSWVAAGYAADVPVAARQGRHLLRHLFHVHSRPVLQHALLTPGFAQRFTFRCPQEASDPNQHTEARCCSLSTCKLLAPGCSRRRAS